MTKVERDVVPNWRSRRFWLKPEVVLGCASSLVYLMIAFCPLEMNLLLMASGLALGLTLSCLTVSLLSWGKELLETKSAKSHEDKANN